MVSPSFSPKICNPFAADIFPDGNLTAGDHLTLHHEAQEQLEDLITQAAHEPASAVRQGNGRVVLLKAPRAGYGKSHLFSRLHGANPAACFLVPLEFDPEQTLSWKSLLDQVLTALHQPECGDTSPALDCISRRTFAMVNAGMIRAGNIPCANPEAAAASLEKRAGELLDFGQPDQPVARWFQEHFERLLPLCVPLVHEETGLSGAAATLWLRALCGYAQGSAGGDPARLSSLQWAIKQPEHAASPSSAGGMKFLQAAPENDAFYKERLGELCRLAAAARPLVVVLDHLDGFHGSSDKVLRLANFLSDWRRLSGRTRFILSVNQDLWSQTFLKSLPSALEDRLTGSQITLGGIGREAAEELIRLRLAAARVPEPASLQFSRSLALPQYFAQEAGKLISPRAVLRYAAQAWDEHWKLPAAPAGDPAIPVAKMRDMLERLRERLAPHPADSPALASASHETAPVPSPASNGYSNGTHAAPPSSPEPKGPSGYSGDYICRRQLLFSMSRHF